MVSKREKKDTTVFNMGLCTSRSTVTLDPSAHILSADGVERATSEGGSLRGSSGLDQGILMVQPLKHKTHDGSLAGGGGGCRPKSVGGVKQSAKGYLELGGKGGEGEAHIWQEAEDQDEGDDGNEVEELINFVGSEESLRSEFLEE